MSQTTPLPSTAVDGPRPYLSVVATARNDDHGGDLLYRLGLFATGLVAQCDRHKLSAELVLVEWNPPAERPSLSDALKWPMSDSCPIRIIEVPHDLHRRFDHSDRLPLFQMIAKNVGIRRAHGAFTLSTNVDVLLSDELVGFIAHGKLEEGAFYRADRYDVSPDIPADAAIEDQLAACRDRVVRISTLTGTRELPSGEAYEIYTDASQRLHRAPRWWLAAAGHALKVIPKRVALRRGLTQTRDSSLSKRARLRLFREAWEWERLRPRLHTNASGDFTLMSTPDWNRLRGYPELPYFSMHLDGLLLFMAHYAGLRQEYLPYPIYHVEHESGFRPDPGSVSTLNNRLVRSEIPRVTDEQLVEWVKEMHQRRAPLQFNESHWGLADEHLRETQIGRRRTEATT